MSEVKKIATRDSYGNALAQLGTEHPEVIPMERILLETDCPYLAPVPNRGKRNDSSNIRYVIEKLAEIKKMSYDEIVDITNNNARRLFFKEA
mgnify:CR=1 FL=1